MYIRKARPEDIDQIAAVEAACFPSAEAASRERLLDRLAKYPDCFWLGRDDFGELICYISGPVTKQADLLDEMYADPSFHDPKGDWLMLFSVCTMPDWRRQGLATLLLNRVVSEAEEKGLKGVVLTCKEDMVRYYGKFGFADEGVSASTHGGAVWHQMRLTFDEDFYLERMFYISDDPETNRQFMEEAIWGAQF